MTSLRVFVLFTVAALAGCSRPVDAPRSARPVRLAQPQVATCSASPRFSGNVQPLARVDLAFKRGGYVADVHHVAGHPRGLVDEGDHVKRGTVLARLRDADYRVKWEQAKAQQIQARAAETQARQDLARAKQLFAGGAMPQSALDGAENKAEAAAAQGRAAQLQVKEAELALADCTLVAPLDAVVLKRLVEPGNLVGPGSPAFVLVDNSSARVTFGVPDVMLDQVKVGARLQVTVEALGAEPVAGEVSRVAPAADPRTRLFEIEVLLPNSDGRLRAGMIASLHMDVASPRADLSVPLSAVVRPPGKREGFAVFVAEGEGLKVRSIEPGELCGSSVEVRAGLKSSERVVVEGAAQAFDGEKVAIVP